MADDMLQNELGQVENAARISLTAIAWWRPELSREAAERYWRDVHGVLDARLPGMHLYRQLHGSTPRDDFFTAVDGIDQRFGEGEAPAAVAHLLFLEQSDVDATVGCELFEYVENDNLALVMRNVHYAATDGARTYVDRTPEPALQGPVQHPTYAVLLREREGLPSDAYRSRLAALAERWAADDNVLRLRLHFFDNAEGQFPLEPQHLHSAWIELIVREEEGARGLLRPEDAEVLRSVQVLEANGIYTLVYDGRPTDVGLRGWPAVEAVELIGAKEQSHPRMLELMYGPIVHGTASTVPSEA